MRRNARRRATRRPASRRCFPKVSTRARCLRAGRFRRRPARAGKSCRARTPADSSTETGPGERAPSPSSTAPATATQIDNDDTSLVTPPVDLSALPTAAIRWNNDYVYANGSTADVDVSIDGGATWTNVWERGLPDAPGPDVESADMSFAAGHAGVQARFHYVGFWAWWWQVDDVLVGQALCNPLPGGLVVGSVRDANTGLGLDGATVTNLGDASVVTTVSTGDPAVGDGYYSLFAGSGAVSLQAALAPYSPQTGQATVVSNGVVRLDIALPAALLDASPRPVSSTVAQGGSDDQVISIGNAGAVAGTFKLLELNAPAQAPVALRPAPIDVREVAAAVHRIPRGLANARDTKGLPLPAGAARLARSAPPGFRGQRHRLVPDEPHRRLGPRVRHRREPPLDLEPRRPVRRAAGRRPRLRLPARRHEHGRHPGSPLLGRRLAGRRHLQPAHRDDLAGQRRGRQLPLRDRSGHEDRSPAGRSAGPGTTRSVASRTTT